MKPYSIFFLSLIFLFSTACEEVIELDLESTDSQLVIEGQITDQSLPATVSLSRSNGFYDTGDYQRVENASVNITDGKGNVFPLTEVAAGQYQSTDIQGEVGENYQLQVEVAGEIVTGNSQLLPSVQLETVSFDDRPGPAGGGDALIPVAHFQDPPGDTYIRFILVRNDTLQNDILLYDDNFTDGQAVEFPIFNAEVYPGDKVQLTTLVIDKGVFDYFNTLANITGQGTGPGGGNSTAPANPETNLEGNALGYFEAASATQIEVVVP
ncbi:MAG: DUF4249 family protein [Bacteroidota bacterium]